MRACRSNKASSRVRPGRVANALLAVLCCVVVSSPVQAAPESELWPYWKTQPGTATFDHGSWDTLLKQFVSAEEDLNVFDYEGLRNTQQSRKALSEYIDSLSKTDPRTLTREDMLAYWINLYNALTVDVVVENWPVGSIKDIRDGLFSPGPWTRKLATIAGEKLSLNDIEHRILRPIFNDPRIHYGVNCASVGCPNLRVDAYTAANADQQLTDAAREFINSERGAMVVAGKLVVSSIYEWFKVDFGDSDSGVIAHLKQYADPELAAALEGVDRISRDEYDWRINALSGTAPGVVMQGSDGGVSTGRTKTDRAQE